MQTERKSPIQRGIENRQKELHEVSGLLATRAKFFSRLAGLGSILTISLGAVVATRDTFLTIFDESLPVVAIFYALVGVLIATIAGLEAAFRVKERAAKLHQLAATSEATKRKADTKWRQEVAMRGGSDEAGNQVLDMQDESLQDVYIQAAELGVNLPNEFRELMEDRNLHNA
jgi:hypothetical protein